MQYKNKKMSAPFWRWITCLLFLVGLWTTGAMAQTVIIGAASGANGTTTYPCPLGDYYTSMRAQYLYTAAELSAAGVTNGSIITDLGWVVNATSITGHSQPGYTISLKNTTLSDLSTSAWETGLIPKYGPATYSYPSGTAGNITFSLSGGGFSYTGGDLVVEVCHTYATTSDYTSNPACQWTTGLTGTKQHTYRADNVTGCGTSTVSNTGTVTTRPRLVLTYISGSGCTGTPAPGNTISSAANVCSGVSFNLSLQNSTSGSGVTYQWQSSPDNATWANISGATSGTLTTNQTAATYYRCNVTCSGNTGTSNSVQVGMFGTAACMVYCVGTATCTGGDHVTNVNFNGGAINNASGVCLGSGGNGAYSDYRTSIAAPSVQAAGSYSISVSVANGGTEYAAAWIDMDHSGTFDASEFMNIPLTLATTWNGTISYAIPSTALSGQTALRIRSKYNGAITNVDACTSFSYGETEDYLINITPAPTCSGTPAPGNTVSSANPACSGATITLSLQFPPTVAGVTYDWQSSPDGVTWTSTGGTGVSYATSQTVATYYQCIVTCTPSGQSATSTPLQVTMNSFLNCYCTPTHTNGTSSGFSGAISNVTLNTLNSTSTYATVAPYYTDFPASGSTTTTLVAGLTYNMSVSSYNYNYVGAWFDWNQNGIFETSEYTYFGVNSTGSPWSSTQAITVPVNAVTGATKMRINTEYYGYTMTSASACAPFTYGETEDYTITVLVAGNCSGTPSASVTTASASGVCSGGSVTLSTNPLYTDAGITYDWQASPDGITWTSTGVTTAQYSVTGFTASTYYQCVVTCTNSGGSSVTSTPVQVTLNPFYNCYCAITNAGGSCITNVTFNTLNRSSAGCENAPSYYTQVPVGTATTTVYQGNTYTFSMTVDAGAIESVWIDYNHSGAFEASEWQQVTTSSASGTPTSINITIPVTSLTGNTGMRVRSRATGNQNGAGDACLAMGSGESEDYVIDIQTPVGCTGSPSASNTVSSVSSICSGTTFNLSLSVAYTAGNITYQWQSSADGVTYSNISGATNSFYVASQTAATWYQCVVTCTNSGQSITSTPVQVTMNAFTSCYCASVAAFTADEEIYSVTVNGASTPAAYAGINGCSTPAPGAGSILSRYSNFTSLGSFTTITQGMSIPFSINEDECDGATYYSNGIAIFIDYNQNGTYEMSEQVYVDAATASGPRTVSGSFTVPFTSLTGQTGMRVICAESYSGASITGCLNYNYGETEDYIVTVVAPAACSGTPSASSSVSSSSSVCPATTFDLSLSVSYVFTGITYQWQSSPNGSTYTNISGATSSPYSTSQTASTYYRCIVTCTNSGQSITSTPVQVTMNTVASCYCVPTYSLGCASGDEITNVTLGTLNNSSTCAASPNYTNYTGVAVTPQIEQNTTYQLSVSFGADANQYFGAWIDYDHNGIFSSSEFLGASGNGGSGGTTSISFTVPSGALNGNTRMRVRGGNDSPLTSGEACGVSSSAFGETEDYEVFISPATCIAGPTYPANGSNGCPNGTIMTLSWPALAGATGYDVYFGTSTPPTSLVSTNQAGLTFNADISGGAPTYYWMVVPQVVGGGTSCSVWSFGLNAAPDPLATSIGDPCEGTTLGLIGDNNASGQTSGNTYQWSGPASFSSNQQNPTRSNAITGYAGTYTLTVTNSFLCTATTTVDVGVNPNPTLSMQSFVNVGCIGGSDGEITVVGSTVGPFDYSIDNFSTVNNSGYFTGLPTGSTTYYVADANGCSGIGSFSLTYTSTTPPSASVVVPFIGMPVNVCNGTSALLSIPAVANTTKYIWDAPTGAYFNGNPSNISPFTTTTPSVQVTYGNPSGSLYTTGVQAANGCGASVRKVQKSRGTISVPASISGATTVCANATEIYSTPAVDAASSYEWTITGNATVSGTGTTATVNFGAGWNGGTLCVAAKTSCYKTPTKCITLGTSASLLTGFAGSITACPNQTLTYSVTASSGAASYTWTLPTGVTGTSTTNSINAAFGAGYNSVGSVCVSVTSTCGITSAQKCKTVAPGLPAQPASVTGYLSGVCNQTVVYSAPPVSGTTFTWSVPSGATVQTGQGTPNISAHFGVLSTGGVCVTASNSCGNSLARCITVKGAPNAPSTVTANPSSWCANTQGIEFSTNTASLSGAYSLNWTYPPASVASYAFGGGNSNSVVLDWISGTGAVNVTASNSCGAATKPSSWSSTCREGEVGTIGTMTIAPNPTTGVLNVSYTATKGHTAINVLDLSGRIVFTQNTNSIEGMNYTQLDLSKLAKGAYMLSVQSTQGSRQVRVVVE